jgi:hypothetical protein
LTRNGLALLVAVLAGGVLLGAFWLASTGQGSRLDVFLLALATIGHVIAVIAWWLAAPWTPRWIVAGYGLILAATGFGFLVSAGTVGGAVLTFYAMGAAGLLVIVAAALRR